MSIDVGELLRSIGALVLVLAVVSAATGLVIWCFAFLSAADEPRWWVAQVAWLVLLVAWPIVGVLLWLVARRRIDLLLERLQPDRRVGRRPADASRRPGERIAGS